MEHWVFHPIFVHFPVAFYLLELVLVLFWIRTREERYRDFARFVFGAAYLSMWIAALAGLYDAGGLQAAVHSSKIKFHFFTASAVIVYYTARLFFWRLPHRDRKYLQLILSLTGNILVALAGFLGGLIVYG